MRWGGILLTATLGAAWACSGESESLLEEYPRNDPGASDSGSGADGQATKDAGPEIPTPIVGKKILDGVIDYEATTSDGHIVFFLGADLMVLEDGKTTPTVIVKDFDYGYDEVLVRGRFVAVWRGESVLPGPLTLWTKSGGVQNAVVPAAYRRVLFAKPASDAFAYYAPVGASALKRDLRATAFGQGAGTTVVPRLDNGYPTTECAPQIAHLGTVMLVAGCPNGTTRPRVATYALDGSGVVKTILDASASGLWMDRKRSRVLVQDASESSIRVIAGASAPVPIDTPIAQAFFASDDKTLLYVRTDGVVRRALTNAPAAPVTVAPHALAMLSASPDARFVALATSGDVSKSETDLVVFDTTAPGTPRTLATEKAVSFGFSDKSTELVYLAPRGLGVEGPLYVVSLPSGTPVKLTDAASQILFDGNVVYWLESDKTTKTNTLKAARVSVPAHVITIDKGLDIITSRTFRTGSKLFVSGKLGLWQYPAVTPQP